MIEYDRYDWLEIVFSFRRTALRSAAGRVLAATLFAVFIRETPPPFAFDVMPAK